ncbi:hypothetical protein [Gordonia sp. (in: high G+C Gram-positive bacteria)]|uniref:hypothetical protein n=1 Tax=Gordonia sp. (in: high G+C Gram-positive bacteria) TaxID=84139 RepID=UPI003C784836
MRPALLLRTVLTAIVSLLVLGMTTAAFPTSAGAAPADAGEREGSIGIRLLDVPVKLKDDPRAQLYIVDNLPPGRTIKRRVQVTNKTNMRTKLSMYAGPAQVVDGNFTPGEPGTKNMLTSWISLDKTELDLKPGEKAKVTATIAVPKDAPEMEQYGVIWASTAPAAPTAGGIAMASRVGVRVYLSVGPGNGPPADFSIGSLTGGRSADGSAIVTAAVTNTGKRAVDVTGDLDLTDGPGGLSAKTVGAQGATISPGQSADVVFTVPDSAALPDGPWQAKVKLESGVHTHEAAGPVTFTASTEVRSTSSSSNTALIWTIVGVLLAIAAAVTAWLWRRKRSAADGGR